MVGATPNVVVRVQSVAWNWRHGEAWPEDAYSRPGVDCHSPSGRSSPTRSCQAKCILGRITGHVHIPARRAAKAELHLSSHFHCGTRGVCLEEMPLAARRGFSGELADRVRRTGDL